MSHNGKIRPTVSQNNRQNKRINCSAAVVIAYHCPNKFYIEFKLPHHAKCLSPIEAANNNDSLQIQPQGCIVGMLLSVLGR